MAKDSTVSGDLFPVLECSSCTLRFTDDVPGEQEIGKYYKSEDYISHTETAAGLVNSLYHRVRRYTLQQKRKLVESLTANKNGVLLDLGCGTGAFLDVMKKGGWMCKGLEPDVDARAIAISRGLDVAPAEAFFTLPPQHYDVITLWHVLEHVHQLHEYVEQFNVLLKRNGVLLVAVPNYTSGDADHYQNKWAAYDVPRHLYHFSPASMRVLMGKHGFTVARVLPMWFDSFYVSMLSEKNYGKKGGLGMASGVLTGLRSNLRVVSDREKCSSLIYVIRRAID
jgi:SAM-dependent methyltransferase